MVDTLSQRFAKLVKKIKGQARFTDSNIADTLREIRIALLEADVALPVVKSLTASLREKALRSEIIGHLTPGQALVGLVNKELIRFMSDGNTDLFGGIKKNNFTKKSILLSGLQGVGKTTTAAKLAYWIEKNHSKKVLLASCDTQRPAAKEQLETLSKLGGGASYGSQNGSSALEIALGAKQELVNGLYDILILDTAGRSAVDEKMMAEIEELHKAVSPTENLFVVDAMQGQDAINVAKAFSQVLPLTGVILTKMDGDARGGAILSVKQVVDVPIKFVGNGEKLSGLDKFDPERTAKRILGMGDIISIVEEMQEGFEEKNVKKLATKIRRGKDLDLDDLKEQIQQLEKMGGAAAILEKLPFSMRQGMSTNVVSNDLTQKGLAIINSMTKSERRHPEILKSSRKRRVAKGSGTAIQEVNRLLSQFRAMQKVNKRIKKSGSIKNLIPRGLQQWGKL